MDSPQHLRLYDEVSAPAYSSNARMRELMMLRRSNLRPNSAALGLVRPSSKTIPYAKEDLYDKVLQMKTEVNFVKQENVKLKTQMKQVRGKLGKPPASEQPYLVTALKQQVEELKTQVQAKEDELAYIKKRSKLTKLVEIETELKVTSDECTRLRRLLYEAIEELTRGVAPLDLQERYLQKKAAYRTLKREFFELSAYVQDNKLKSKSEVKVKKTLSVSFADLKMENALLSQELKQVKDAPCPHCQSRAAVEGQSTQDLLLKVWLVLLGHGMTIQDFWTKLDPEAVGAVKPHAVVRKLQELGLQLSSWEADKLLGMLRANQGEAVHRAVLEEALELCRPAPTLEQQQLVTHLVLKLQGLRMETADITGLLQLPESQCHMDTLRQSLMNSSLKFPSELSEGFARLVMTGYSSIPTNRLLHRIRDLVGTIEPLDSDKEAQMDAELRSLFAGNKEALVMKLQSLDPRGQGWVTFQDFWETVATMGLSLSPHLQNYLRVLFYADRQELDKVPYETFAQAFCLAQ